MKTVTAVVIGAGERGAGTYAPFSLAYPEEVRIVGVAEPDDTKRRDFQALYGLPDEACFVGYKEFFESPIPADCAYICTQDQMHTEPAVLAMRQGYHVLLEKPMAVTEADCRLLVKTAQETGRQLVVCHVLRYTPFYSALKDLLDSGRIGKLLTVQHMEGVAYWHFAHSFVRGNWSVTKDSAPMILAKCCHDLDLLSWLVGGKAQTVSSFGKLSYFTAANAPQGAPMRCTDGCPHARQCLYYAPDLYLGEHTDWPTSAISADHSFAARKEALLHGPYGRCVFHCDNDVCDHQTVDIYFDNEVTVNMTATAFSTEINRQTTFTGTKGEMIADFHDNHLIIKEHGTGRVEDIRLNVGVDILGHGGGDWKLLRDFLDIVRDGQGEAKTLAENSLASHLLAFAAEKSRLEGVKVTL